MALIVQLQLAGSAIVPTYSVVRKKPTSGRTNFQKKKDEWDNV